MFLVVGLGNPGPEYELTPHNLGFLAIDELARLEGVRVQRPEANALVGHGEIGKTDVVLAKPLSYMNLSGGPVKVLARKYEIPPERVLIVYDELALPWGHIRVRERGSAGGHNGVKSLIQGLGTQEFPRVRMGIQPDHPVADSARYVLAPVRRERLEELPEFIERAVDAVRTILSTGAEKAMAKFNRRAGGPKAEDR